MFVLSELQMCCHQILVTVYFISYILEAHVLVIHNFNVIIIHAFIYFQGGGGLNLGIFSAAGRETSKYM